MKNNPIHVMLIAVCLSGAACSTAPKSSNPLLNPFDTPFGVPPFDKIKTGHYLPAFEEALAVHRREIAAIVDDRSEPDFENVIAALDRSGTLLRNVASVFYGVSSANTNDSLQAVGLEVGPRLTGHFDDIYMNGALFAKVKAVYDRREALNLDSEQLRLTTETCKSFIRNGAALSPADHAALRKLNGEITTLQLTFEQNLLAENNAFGLTVTDEAQLKGLPDAQKKAAAQRAADAGKQGWLFTLHNPSVMPFLQYAENRELRREMLHAYLNRGNNNNDNDNKAIVAALAAKRLQKAKLLGYINYADYVLDDCMAKNPENVYALLNRIWTPALAKARQEAADMLPLMLKERVQEPLEACDWRYYSEKALRQQYDIDEEVLRPYFKLDNVREGVFYTCNRLYGISFEEVTDIPKYDDEVVAYRCNDADGSLLGIVYMDFFPRAGKAGGAWCGTYRDVSYRDGKRIPVVTSITCNFTRPVGDAPALLSPDETETFFHEFGHALHNLFCTVRYQGITNVPRDFVELPSQIMEHWAFRPEVLSHYARHYLTGEVIPDALVKKITGSRKYGQGFATVEYLAASFLDMDYHTLTAADSLPVIQFEHDAMDRIGLIPQIPPRYRSTYFAHSMGGGYTAGYYSYIWAEVLDADAFQAFVETGDIFDRATATAFRKCILEKGGSSDAMQLYLNFRGEEPSIQALLENRGL